MSLLKDRTFWPTRQPREAGSRLLRGFSSAPLRPVCEIETASLPNSRVKERETNMKREKMISKVAEQVTLFVCTFFGMGLVLSSLLM
jgi:hypothetical protein